MLQILANLAQILGAVAVIAGIAFGFTQVRQFRQQRRDALAVELMKSIQGAEFTLSLKYSYGGPRQYCWGTTCGTFETTYTFTAKYVDDTFAEEIHGRCHHPIVGGTGDFAGKKGVILFKDDVVNLKFDYRGHIK